MSSLEQSKIAFLKSHNWFYMDGAWRHPNLPKGLELQQAYMYETFKEDSDEDELLFDDDMGS